MYKHDQCRPVVSSISITSVPYRIMHKRDPFSFDRLMYYVFERRFLNSFFRIFCHLWQDLVTKTNENQESNKSSEYGRTSHTNNVSFSCGCFAEYDFLLLYWGITPSPLCMCVSLCVRACVCGCSRFVFENNLQLESHKMVLGMCCCVYTSIFINSL